VTSSGIAVYGLDGRRQAVLPLPRGYVRYREFPGTWARDGRSVLVRLEGPDGEGARTWELPIDGGAPRRVPAEDPRSHVDAVSSPDGARVAFVGLPDSHSLVIAEADGTELRVLPGARISLSHTPDDGDFYGGPVWSPSGDRVAFSWSVWDLDLNEDGPVESAFELRVVEVSSGKVTRLVAGPGVQAIDFSPEGDRILLVKNNSLWTVNADGSNAELVVAGASNGDWQWRPATP
jgi:dipeptidyl aminopeptidase/acylaminoacyl peptidase